MSMRNFDQAAGIRSLHRTKPVRVFAIASGKGGVGKTNISVNLGVCLAEMGRSVLLLDADMGLANVDVLLGLHPPRNFSHVLSVDCALDAIMVEGPAGIRIIPGASGIENMSSLSAFEQAAVIRAFGDLDQEVDVMIVDTAAGISSATINFLRASQQVIVVVCDEPTSLTDAYALIKLLNLNYGVDRFRMMANMVRDERHGRDLFSKLRQVADKYLEVFLEYLGAVPYDECLRKSVSRQQAVVTAYPRSESARAFRNLARAADVLPLPHRSSGQLEFFAERMIRYASQEGVR